MIKLVKSNYNIRFLKIINYKPFENIYGSFCSTKDIRLTDKYYVKIQTLSLFGDSKQAYDLQLSLFAFLNGKPTTEFLYS